ncbi:UNVERIFIED_CONTAM: hypothetical protein NCL1_48851 [Trichonephila clavipes]
MVAEHLSSAWFEAEWKELDCKYEKDSCPVAEPKGLKCRTVFDVVRTGMKQIKSETVCYGVKTRLKVTCAKEIERNSLQK